MNKYRYMGIVSFPFLGLPLDGHYDELKQWTVAC